MDKEALYHKLKDYLDGKLSEEEHRDLKTRINTDEAIAEQLALVRLEKELADLMLDDELDTKMAEWSKEEQLPPSEKDKPKEPANKNKPSRGWWLGILAVLSVVVITYWLLRPGQIPPSLTPATNTAPPTSIDETVSDENPTLPDQVDDQKQEDVQEIESTSPQQPIENKRISTPKDSRPVAEQTPSENNPIQQLAMNTAAQTSPIGSLGISRAAEQTDESSFQKGYRLMGEGKLEEAQQVLETISDENRALYLNAQQYLAYVYFEQANYQAVIPIFESLIAVPYANKEQMEWLLALAYLATGEESKGLALAEAVAKSEKESPITKVAKSFLEEIKD